MEVEYKSSNRKALIMNEIQQFSFYLFFDEN